jgi:hypothetical protein
MVVRDSNGRAQFSTPSTGNDAVNLTYTDANYQPLDEELTEIAALVNTDGNFIVGTGTVWQVESGGTARVSIGLATVDQSEAEAGTATTDRAWTAERVKQAVQALGFPTDTAMLFYQADAPTGWTPIDTFANHGIQLVASGDWGTGSSGTDTFEATFSSTKTANDHTLLITQIPNKTGTAQVQGGQLGVFTSASGVFSITGTNGWRPDGSAPQAGYYYNLNFSLGGGGQGHNHTIDMDLRHVQVILADKD